MFKFSRRSKEKLFTCDEQLVLLFAEVIDTSPIDFGIAEGHRSIEKQKEYFNDGKSNCDGTIKKSNHNFYPSKAVDIYAYVNGEASWEKEHLCLIAGVVFAAAKKFNVNIRWGGTFDSDNFKGWDMPHFELI